MSVNRYLQHLAKNSTSSTMRGVGKKIHNAAAFVDRASGHSAAKARTQAATAIRTADTPRNQRFADKLLSRAVKEKNLRGEARFKAGVGLAVGYGVKKALQPPKRDVYYDSY